MIHQNIHSTFLLLTITAFSSALTACNSTAASVNPSSHESVSVSLSSATTPVSTPHSKFANQYPSCVSSDPNHICIGLKIVSYRNAAGVPVLTKADAITLVNGMNQVWSQCNIAYQLELYQTVDPTKSGLNYSPDWQVESDDVREKFKDPARFVIIAVGPWSVATIAVTNMPGSELYGTLVDNHFAHNALTVGHELGHYQGLYHVDESTNLMNSFIGESTSGLSANECEIAVTTDRSDWQLMMRKPI